MLINLLNKVEISSVASVSVMTVTGKSVCDRTLQSGIIIVKIVGVWCYIVFAKCKCNCVCD